LLDNPLAFGSLALISRQENHPHSDALPRGQPDSLPRQFSAEKARGELKQHACTVASFGIGGDGTSVAHATERRQSHLQNVMTASAPKISDESNSTTVAFGEEIEVFSSSLPRFFLVHRSVHNE
jgi:hypothetical protein